MRKQEDHTTFGSSNKNSDLISTWRWDTGSVPAKDDLSNVYAYASVGQTVSGSELIFYAGLERRSPRGDSHLDIEINKELILLDKEPACNGDGTGGNTDGAPCEFSGERGNNDLLLVIDFKRGGDLSFVEIRRWNDTTRSGIFLVQSTEKAAYTIQMA